MEKTLFEKIALGEIDAEIVYRDEHTVAFLDINPVHAGHTLVIPTHAYRNLMETPDEQLAHIMATVKKVSQALMQSLNADGINVIFNNEAAAGQIIFHTHAHVIPRYANDGFHGWTQTKYKDGEMHDVGEKMRKSL